MLLIDGAFGEGGGQILRTSLSLSIITQLSFKIFNIRANRPKPGLQPQHLTCVKAAAVISKAEVKGDFFGSKELTFSPKILPAPEVYKFSIGTAGSTSLLFQTLLYPLAWNKGGVLLLEGGTHVPYSPSYHYLKYVFLPIVELFGLKAEIEIQEYGFYPIGEGKIKAKVYPWENFLTPAFSEKFVPGKLEIYSVISDDLPEHILERQIKGAMEILKKLNLESLVEIKVEKVRSKSPGTFVFICVTDETGSKKAGFIELGKKGYPAEEVGKNAALKFIKFLETDAQFEEHLTDQILIPLGLVLTRIEEKKEYFFTTSKVTKHQLTQMWLIPKFLKNINIQICGEEGKKGYVKISRR